MKYNLKQKSKRQTFDTGAQRDTQEGKPRCDLISPIMLERLGTLLAKGAEHYGERNWEKGMPLSRLLASAMSHMIKTLDGLEEEDHPIQCIFNLMAYIHTLHRIRAGSLPVELDDMPREQNLREKNLKESLTSDEKRSRIKQQRKEINSSALCPRCNRKISTVEYMDMDIVVKWKAYCPRCNRVWDVHSTSDKKGPTINKMS